MLVTYYGRKINKFLRFKWGNRPTNSAIRDYASEGFLSVLARRSIWCIVSVFRSIDSVHSEGPTLKETHTDSADTVLPRDAAV